MTRRLPAALVALLAFVGGALATETVKLKPKEVLYADSKGVGLREPYAAGCSATSIVVADSGNGRLVVYAIEARGATARAEIVLPELPFPIRVRQTQGGEILALDGRSRRIARVAAAGELRGWLDVPAAGPTPVEIRSLAVTPDGRVYVLDVGETRVVVLDAQGKVERTIAFAPDHGSPSDVAVDGHGQVYVIDSVRRRVDVAKPGDAALAPLTGSLTEDMEFPTSIAVDDEGRIFVLDEHGGGLVILGRDGSFRGRQLGMGWKDGLVRYPKDLCLAGGNLVVADRGNNRVQVFGIGP